MKDLGVPETNKSSVIIEKHAPLALGELPKALSE